MKPLLQLDNVCVSVKDDDRELPLLFDTTLSIHAGEIHALMGPNGSGKSTLARAIAGHPSTVITKGTIFFRGEDITKLSADERARKGLFLAFQQPVEIPGVSTADILKAAKHARKEKSESPTPFTTTKLIDLLKEPMHELKVDKEFIQRPLDHGLSGGEKKKLEMIQAAILKPLLCIADEIDAGLDIDALKNAASVLRKLVTHESALLLITHHQRLLQHLPPTHVHLMSKGRIVKSGDKKLVAHISQHGYDN